jgi:hypothetical protein
MGMEWNKRSVLMMSAPAVAAFLIGAILPVGAFLNTTDQFSEQLAPTGYVTVSQVRNGVEIFHYEDHNAITETGVDFIIQQVSGTPSDTESAQWIALTTTDITPDDDLSSLAGEITSGGLDRTQGTLSYTPTAADDDDNYTVSVTFTATGSHSAVQGAGLFTLDVTGTPGAGDDDGTMVAVNEFSSVNLANGDQLTITWTVDLGAGLDA